MCIIRLAEGISNPLLKGWAYITVAKASLRASQSSTVLPERSRSMAQGQEINLSQTLLSSLVQGPAYRVKFKSQPAWLLKFSFQRPQPPYPILSQLEHSSLPPRPYHPPLASGSFLQIKLRLPLRPKPWPTRLGPFIERAGQFRARGSMTPKTRSRLA